MENQSDRPAGTGGCGCQGTGPILTDFIRKMGPSDDVKQHFRNARVEILKGLRAMLDEKIECLSRAAQAKGSKIVVE
jgi:hypothetical protein